MKSSYNRLNATAPLLLVATTFAPFATPALAQEVQQDTTLAEVVVTANRRSESIQDVPISIVAMDQASMDVKGVRDIADIARLTPGVNFQQSSYGSTNISIRGISSRVGAPTTGIYIDDTPIQARPTGLSPTSGNFYPGIFDLERVEVLRGPQGTLFGAGSEGGTIRFITPKPSLTDLSAYTRAEAGFTDGGDPSYEAGGAIGGPLVDDRLGARVSGYYRRDGGWIDRVPAGGAAEAPEKNANTATTVAGRGALTFAATDNFEITPAVFYQRTERDDLDLYTESLSNPSRGRFVAGSPLTSPGTDRMALYSVNAEYDFDGITLFSTTSYVDREQTMAADNTPNYSEQFRLPLIASNVRSVSYSVNAQSGWTQEFRLQSDADERLKWVTGLFYQNIETTQHYDAIGVPDAGSLFLALFRRPLPPEWVLPRNAWANGDNVNRDKQYAVFGQIDYEIVPAVTVTLGGRYADTKFESVDTTYGIRSTTPPAYGEQTGKPFTPKLGVKYEPNADVMLYASASKGFRVGGTNQLPTATGQLLCASEFAELGGYPLSYGNDSVWNYEVGAKGRLSNAISFESSIYQIDWKNIQALASLRCGLNVITNVGSARVRGFDAHLTVAPIEGLTLEAAVAHNDATYSENGYVGTLLFVSEGDKLNTPPWSGSLSGDYSFPVSDLKTAYVHLDYQVQSAYSVPASTTGYSFDVLDPRRTSNDIVSARFGIQQGGLDVSLFVDNLLNSHEVLAEYRDSVSTQTLRQSTYRPRTIGVTASFRY